MAKKERYRKKLKSHNQYVGMLKVMGPSWTMICPKCGETAEISSVSRALSKAHNTPLNCRECGGTLKRLIRNDARRSIGKPTG